ncbi:MAG: membrane protein [Peptococcaceae bacterium BRH_c8a]|nr:MAG: membrane protein [Peptococcaceae bacterium BRH_c8a]
MLLYCSWAGIGMLAVTFLIYMSGFFSPFIPASEMPMYWGMSAHEFLVETGAPIGWGWLGMLGYGDFVNLLGIAFLALLTIVGYLVLLLPAYLRKKDIAYASIVVVEILVLTLAASGVLAVGAH